MNFKELWELEAKSETQRPDGQQRFSNERIQILGRTYPSVDLASLFRLYLTANGEFDRGEDDKMLAFLGTNGHLNRIF